jgi:dihydroorotase
MSQIRQIRLQAAFSMNDVRNVQKYAKQAYRLLKRLKRDIPWRAIYINKKRENDVIFNYINTIDTRVENVSLNCPISEEGLYISPPWIDFHCHVYHGFTSLGLKQDDIGYRAGVHLLIDAGSAGEETFVGFRDYVLPCYKTKVLAFLNISAIGLVSMQECHDMRKLDPERAAECVKSNPGLIVGIKVRSSEIIVEGKGTEPLKQAVKAANLAECPLLVHFGENPPSNGENLSLMRKGDIVTHCFHGKEKPLWDDFGNPIPELEKALADGIKLDVGHGIASLDLDVAKRAVEKNKYEFSISSDLHGRNIYGPVYSLSCTMSKFLSIGVSLLDTIKSVTQIPAKRLGLTAWCSDPEKNATVFRVREKNEKDPLFTDSYNKVFPVQQVIEPVAVIMDGQWISI